MKKRSLFALLIPLCALSGCSYRGDAKPLRDGNLLLSESFTSRDDTFEVVDQHIKAMDTFCIYFSLEGCSACERFTEGIHCFNVLIYNFKSIITRRETVA